MYRQIRFGRDTLDLIEMGDWKDAVQCRNRAELLRELADKSEDGAFRSAVRNVATHYEKMAESLECDLRPPLVAT